MAERKRAADARRTAGAGRIDAARTASAAVGAGHRTVEEHMDRLGAAQTRIAYSVGRLDRAVRQRLGEATSRFGLTVAQYTALSVLEARGPLSNAQLARRSFVTPQAMNEIIAALARQDMVAREPDPRHGRIVRIGLTRKGGKMLRQCDTAARRVEEAMLAGLGRAKRTMLLDLLRGCVAALETPRPAHGKKAATARAASTDG